jgi:DNA polymerase-1
MSRKSTLYLIDASSYVYRAFHALPPLTSPSGMPTNAAYGFATMVLKLLRDTGATHVAAVFDAPGKNFRHAAFPEYKANRAAMPDDLRAQIPLVHEIADSLRLRRLCVDGVEADDVIASICARMARRGVDVVVVTGDKDLMQIVGPHVKLWDTMRDKWYDDAEVERRMGVPPAQVPEVLGLMGDSVDNVPGVKGVGEKTAVALVQRFGSIEGLLAHLDELVAEKTVRGAAALAEKLRVDPEPARLSRRLVELDLGVDIPDDDIDDFRHTGVEPDAIRPLLTRLGFQSLLKSLPGATGTANAVEIRLAADAGEVAAAVGRARAQGEFGLVCDGSFARGERRCTAVLLALDSAGVDRIDVTAGVPRPLAELLADPGVAKVAHDLKRELLTLSDGDADDVGPAFDTMIASYLAEASATHRLEDLAADLLGRRIEAFRDSESGAAAGAAVLLELRERLAATLHERELEGLFRDIEMPLVGVLTRMERRGVRLDVAVLRDLAVEIDARLAVLETEIHELAGGPFNIASPPQLRDILFDKLGLSTKGVKRGKTGLSTDVDVLTKLASEHPLPAKILDFRGLAKLKSTYVEALPAAVNPVTGRLHTNFNQTVAATGRLSSSDPNLQNIPIRSDDGRRIRAAFVAEPGHCLIGADYSQIELRLLAHLSVDPALLEAFQRDEDVHSRTASEVFGVLPGAISAEMRRAAKVINFGIIYGMGPQRLARELGIPLRQAQQYIEQYFARYAGVRTYMEGVLAAARETGYVTTLFGRRRSLPDLVGRDRVAIQAAERTATNTPIQGSAADLIKVAMVTIDGRLRAAGLRTAMILQVHDELLFEVPLDEADRVEELVRSGMEEACTLRVPLRVDIRRGRNWAEVH